MAARRSQQQGGRRRAWCAGLLVAGGLVVLQGAAQAATLRVRPTTLPRDQTTSVSVYLDGAGAITGAQLGLQVPAGAATLVPVETAPEAWANDLSTFSVHTLPGGEVRVVAVASPSHTLTTRVPLATVRVTPGTAPGPIPLILTSASVAAVDGVSRVPLKRVTIGGTLALLRVNRPPALTPLGDRTVKVGVPLFLQLRATDPDRDRITYALRPRPRGSNFEPRTGLFVWYPQRRDLGTYRVTFTVSDGQDSTSQTVTIRVRR